MSFELMSDKVAVRIGAAVRRSGLKMSEVDRLGGAEGSLTSGVKRRLAEGSVARDESLLIIANGTRASLRWLIWGSSAPGIEGDDMPSYSVAPEEIVRGNRAFALALSAAVRKGVDGQRVPFPPLPLGKDDVSRLATDAGLSESRVWDYLEGRVELNALIPRCWPLDPRTGRTAAPTEAPPRARRRAPALAIVPEASEPPEAPAAATAEGAAPVAEETRPAVGLEPAPRSGRRSAREVSPNQLALPLSGRVSPAPVAPEVWRGVTSDGEVLSLTVHVLTCPCPCGLRRGLLLLGPSQAPVAIEAPYGPDEVRRAAGAHLALSELRAPGELTTEERLLALPRASA